MRETIFIKYALEEQNQVPSISIPKDLHAKLLTLASWCASSERDLDRERELAKDILEGK